MCSLTLSGLSNIAYFTLIIISATPASGVQNSVGIIKTIFTSIVSESHWVAKALLLF
jgi:hypothetical protein